MDSGHTGYILVCMALVNLMTPGLAFFYGGLVRSSNVLTIMMQNYVSMGLVTIIWLVWGYSLCFGTSKNGVIGSARSHYMLEDTLDASGNVPELLVAGFQGMFAVIAPALMTGAFADRVRFVPYIIFIVVWVHPCVLPLLPLGVGKRLDGSPRRQGFRRRRCRAHHRRFLRLGHRHGFAQPPKARG